MRRDWQGDVGRGRIILAELKAQNGRITDDQRAWLKALANVPSLRIGDRHALEVHVWRPRDWLAGEIEAALR